MLVLVAGVFGALVIFAATKRDAPAPDAPPPAVTPTPATVRPTPEPADPMGEEEAARVRLESERRGRVLFEAKAEQERRERELGAKQRDRARLESALDEARRQLDRGDPDAALEALTVDVRSLAEAAGKGSVVRGALSERAAAIRVDEGRRSRVDQALARVTLAIDEEKFLTASQLLEEARSLDPRSGRVKLVAERLRRAENAPPETRYPLRCSSCSADLGASISFPPGRDPGDRLRGYFCEACAPAQAAARADAERSREEARSLEVLDQALAVVAEGRGPEELRARVRAKLDEALGLGALRARVVGVEEAAAKLVEAAGEVAAEKPIAP